MTSTFIPRDARDRQYLKIVVLCVVVAHIASLFFSCAYAPPENQAVHERSRWANRGPDSCLEVALNARKQLFKMGYSSSQLSIEERPGEHVVLVVTEETGKWELDPNKENVWPAKSGRGRSLDHIKFADLD